MSPQKLAHSVSNELAILLGRAELLAGMTSDRAALEHVKLIKTAALNIRDLMHQFQEKIA